MVKCSMCIVLKITFAIVLGEVASVIGSARKAHNFDIVQGHQSGGNYTHRGPRSRQVRRRTKKCWRMDSNPHGVYTPSYFKSDASADSATPALLTEFSAYLSSYERARASAHFSASNPSPQA